MTSVRLEEKEIFGEVKVPSSKSESNRALLINALLENRSEIENLSDADDTRTLSQLLSSDEAEINAGDGGTTFRFLLAYYVLKSKECVLTGSERMNQRPVAPLVGALNSLGAKISYLEKEGFAPLKIGKGNLKGGEIAIDAGISSQFISALMMIAPLLEGGLTIHLSGEIVSAPYILMTKKIMEHYGADIEWNNNTIQVKEGKYVSKPFHVNGDWTASSYFYGIAALSGSSEIKVNNLSHSDLQGDMAITEIMKVFGVETKYNPDSIIISKNKNFQYQKKEKLEFNFIDHPDIALTVAAVCAATNQEADLKGLNNLSLKESDRVSAFQREIYKLNILTDFCGHSKLKIYNDKILKFTRRVIKTYHDHRIAMVFALLATETGGVNMDNKEVVKKSFPGFWDEIKKLGFVVDEIIV